MTVLTVRLVRSLRAAEEAAVEPAPAVRPERSGGPTTLPFTSGFVGRSEDLAWIGDALATEHAVALVGRRAVGTSSCVVQAANLIRERASGDRIHYLDLRAGGRRMRAGAVVAALARALGAAPPRSRRPAALRAAVLALRDRLDDERILLVLDNVDELAQVRALLPPVARCRLLLAGTPGLARAEGVAARWLTEPSQDDAVELFVAAGQTAVGASTRRPDPRRDPAVREIVDLCGRQPRTIRALGYRMARHGWRSADLLATLRNAVTAPAHHRVPPTAALTLLTDPDTAYAALSPVARRVFRLMSLAPAPLDRPALAVCTGLPPDRRERVLDELANGAFVQGAAGDRYEIRSLLAGYARLHLRRSESTRRRVAALTRLLRHLARQAERSLANLTAAGLTAGPGISGAPEAGRDSRLPFEDDPYAWLDRHAELLDGIVRTVPGTPGAAEPLPRQVRRWWFRLAVVLCGWYAHENQLDEWAAVCQAVLAAPTARDRREIAGWAHNELGVLRRRRGDPQGAAAALTLALAERGHRGTAQAHMNLGLALLDLGHVEEAIEHLELARRHRGHTDRSGRALSDLALGAAYLAHDAPEAAHHHLVRAANTFRALGESRAYAAALTNLVLAQSRLGEHLDAAQSWNAALREHEYMSDPAGRATALLNAGATMVTSTPSRAKQAYDLLNESRRLRDGSPPSAGLGRTLLYLGDAARALDRPEEARAHWIDAAEVCAAVGDADGAAAADRRLST
jgi:tetratricopeptide (TPR) repeat protein